MAEGRDIGTVVAPTAIVKVFLTADSAARGLPPCRAGSPASRLDPGRPGQAGPAGHRAEREGRGRGGDWTPDRPDPRRRSSGRSSDWLANAPKYRRRAGRSDSSADRTIGPRRRGGGPPSQRGQVHAGEPASWAAGRRSSRTFPGVTTRDRITYDALWRGRAFTLVDTGGWEPSVEGTQSLAARVAEQAKIAVGAADAQVLFVDRRDGRGDRRGRGGGRGAAPLGQAGRARGEQGGRHQGGARGRRALVAGSRRAGPGQRAARQEQRRPARPHPGGAAGRARGGR